MDVSITGPQANLIASYTFESIIDGASGITDESGSGHDGTLNGTTVAAASVTLNNGVTIDGYATNSDGTDALIAIENVTGSDHNDNLTGNTEGNILRGGDGFDTLYGDEGADTFVFDNLIAFSDVDAIYTFSTAESDALDISSLLTGHTSGVDNITDFVQITTVGANS